MLRHVRVGRGVFAVYVIPPTGGGAPLSFLAGDRAFRSSHYVLDGEVELLA